MRACHLNTCPVGDRDAGPRAAQALRRHAGARHQLLPLRRRGGAADPREPRPAHDGRAGRPRRPARADARGRPLEGARARPLGAARRCPTLPPGTPLRRVRGPEPVLDDALDWDLIERARRARSSTAARSRSSIAVRNTNRCVGGLLSGTIARRHGAGGLARGLDPRAASTARPGRASAAGSPRASPSRSTASPTTTPARGSPAACSRCARPHDAAYVAEENVIVGNTVLYGATSGRAFFRGLAGERFARAQLGRARRRRGRRRSRLRVHDRRARRRARADRAQLRGRHERRRRLRPTTRSATSRRGAATARACPSRRSTRPTRSSCAALVAEHAQRTGSAVAAAAARRLGDEPRPLRQGHAGRLPPRARRAGGRSPASSPRSARDRGRCSADGRAAGVHAGRPRADPGARRARTRPRLPASSRSRGPVEELREQGARCMECGVPFCHSGCPLGNLIPDWNDLVYRDRWHDAIRQLHYTNNFPEFTGRLCPAPCEAACVLEINEGDVGDDQADRERDHQPRVRRGLGRAAAADAETGRRVAVVGSGPAGLAAAQQLRRAGHGVVVFERDEAAGGLVRFGVPDFKIEKRIVQRRVDQLVAEGVELRLGVDVGVDVDARGAAGRVRRRRARDRLARPARPRGAGPRAAGHALRDGVPLRAQPLGGDAVRPGARRRGAAGQRDQRRRDATSS